MTQLHLALFIDLFTEDYLGCFQVLETVNKLLYYEHLCESLCLSKFSTTLGKSQTSCCIMLLDFIFFFIKLCLKIMAKFCISTRNKLKLLQVVISIYRHQYLEFQSLQKSVLISHFVNFIEHSNILLSIYIFLCEVKHVYHPFFFYLVYKEIYMFCVICQTFILYILVGPTFYQTTIS